MLLAEPRPARRGTFARPRPEAPVRPRPWLVAALLLCACSQRQPTPVEPGVIHLVDVLRLEDGTAAAVGRQTFHGLGMEAVVAESGAKLTGRVPLPGVPATLHLSVAAVGPEGTVTAEVRGVDGSRVVLEDRERWVPLTLALDRGSLGEHAEIVLAGEGPEGTTLVWGSPVVSFAGSRSGLRDVILYEIDTLRADVLEPYGYPGRSSPVIGSLSRRGTIFAECRATSSWTRPSAVSILTSLSAPAHGVIDEGLRLPESVVTLAELLQDAGWYTVAFQTNPNAGRQAGLDRGFDLVFEMDDLIGHVRRRAAEWQGAAQLSTGMTGGTTELIAFRLERLLPEWRDLPLFLYLHPNDPHAPYDPREPFASIPDLGRAGAPARIARPLGRYAGDVRAADHFLGEVLEGLAEEGRLAEAAVVLLSDHGEEFREHGERGHGIQLFEESLRTPCVLVAPGIVPAARVCVERAGGLDVLPTLLEIAGVDLPAGIEGRSLLPSLRDPDVRERVTETPSFAHVVTMPLRLHEAVMADPSVIGTISVVRGEWKCIVEDYATHRKPSVALFDLERDPAELRDVASVRPEIAGELEGEARAWWAARSGAATAEPSEVDPAAEEQLRALGYTR
jgi:arylsulfatase A-like enzyme